MADIDWPLMTNKIRRGLLNHTFGMVRKYANGTPKAHQGWDLEALIGTETYAISDGTIKFVKNNQGDYGTQVLLQFDFNGETLYALYAHLDAVYVSAGKEVKLGQTLGTTGESGNAQGMAKADQHLHFEIREVANAGLGLAHRRSPLKVFGVCPLHQAESKKLMMSLAP
jgi:murein DD-endopeptidase MepM/ murein hydrolase activator NlpD